jgi:hypothetical protein
MADNTNYNDNVRKLTTAAEQDDAVTTGRILQDLGPEQWGKAVKDMLALNQKDIKDAQDSGRYDLFIPALSVELDKAGSKETLTVYQAAKEPFAVAKITEDVAGKNLTPTLANDVTRQLTSAAESGDAVETARILKSIGPDKWAQVTKDMVALNQQDIRNRTDLNHRPPFVSVSYEKNGSEETISVYSAPEYQSNAPLARVTEKK